MAEDYAVGYGKPPAHTRFKAGKSGNPKGRPKGLRNLKTDFIEILSERIAVREGDRELYLTKQQALLRSLFARAVQGGARPMAEVLKLAERYDSEPEADLTYRPSSTEDKELVESFLEHATGQTLKVRLRDDD